MPYVGIKADILLMVKCPILSEHVLCSLRIGIPNYRGSKYQIHGLQQDKFYSAFAMDNWTRMPKPPSSVSRNINCP